MKLIQDLPELFEEFSEKRRQAFLDIKEYKDKGVPVVGMYCAYFPTELAMAIGAIPVGLCSFSNGTVPIAEQDMPKSMCPLVKSSYGFAKSDKCPFFHFADLVIGETTCDGKKKMYEMMAEFKPVFVMELPNSQSERGMEFWRQEVIRTKEYLEDFFNIYITDQMLRDAVHLGNQIRTSLKRLCEVMKLDPAPVLGENIQNMITGSKYRFDFKTTPAVVDAVTDRILEEYAAGKKLEHRPRILVTGCPIGGDSMKIIHEIEENGGVVVAVENCSGVKTLDRMIDEDNPDIYGAIARRYLSTGCSIMTPNDNRIELIGRIIDEYKVDGVVEMILTGCHATGAESAYIRKFVNEEKKLPYISIDTDYSKADTAQISTRLAAFLELIDTPNGAEDDWDVTQCYRILVSGFANDESVKEILEEIWKYTKVSICVFDYQRYVRVGVGALAFNDDYQNENCVEQELEQMDGKVVALCEEKSRNKIEKLVEIIASCYHLGAEKEKKEVANKGRKPDFLWILSDRRVIEEKLFERLSEAKSFQGDLEIDEETGIFVSGLCGMKDRKLLIEDCKKYIEDYHGNLLIGNGFHSDSAISENKNIQKRLLEYISRTSVKKKIHLTEEYYHELAVSYIGSHAKGLMQPEEIGILRKYDEEQNTNLYEALYWYLRTKRNVTKAAARLKVHRNTMISRIAKINELVHVDEKSGAECEILLIGMEINEYRRNKLNISLN